MTTHHDIFQGGHVGKKPDVLKGSGNALANRFVWGIADQRRIVEHELTTVWNIKAGQAVEKRGFARAIRTDEAIDLTGI